MDEATEIKVNPEKLARYKSELSKEQNFTFGLIAGVIACIISAIIWAAITYFTGYQISYMAIGVGIIVGFAIRLAGKGLNISYSIMGGLLALLGCILGNFLTLNALIADMNGESFLTALGFADINLMIEMLKQNTGFIDLLFYAAATFLGFVYAQREISDEELIELQ